jgi:membrane protein YdbS with pleckstrin-like domain
MNETFSTAPEAAMPDVSEPKAEPPPPTLEPKLEPDDVHPLDVNLESNREHRLDPQYVSLQRSVGWIVTAVISAGLAITMGIVWLAADLPWMARVPLIPGWLLVTLGLAWMSHVWPEVHHRHVSYTLDAEGIEIRSGVWWRQIISVPRSRVQHIDVSQGPIERSYGLGRLVLYTAGTAHSRVELHGLSYPVAFALRKHLLPRGSDDAV